MQPSVMILIHPQANILEMRHQMILREALEPISGIEWKRTPDVDICGISYDSRSVQKGDLFVAIRGEKTDGARFIPEAIARGAVAVAAERRLDSDPRVAIVVVSDTREFLAEISRVFYGDPSSKLKLVGITGTNGKTTTSYLMDSIFRSAGIRSCLIGTLGMKIGERSFPSERTTPESSDLARFLQRAVMEGCTHGVLEVSSHSLALKRVFGTKFATGVFMNLTRDPLDFNKDMENYFRAKQLLFSPESGNRIETAVINMDDPYGNRLEQSVGCPVLRFGFHESANIHVRDCRSHTQHTDLVLATPAGEAEFRTRLIGRPNMYNIMAAVGAAHCLGFDLDKICNGIEALNEVPGRMELVDAGQDFAVIVDYAHSPDALENLLKTVAQLPHKKLITVFGCGGDRDRTKRPIMGVIAANMSSLVLATSDNPRSEDPLEILREIEIGLKKGTAPYKIVPDRHQAIESAVGTAEEGDVVIIAGKGHEDYQIIGSQVIPFDDRKLARDLIRKRLEPKDHR
jgi:UDP-N-acetylmuramoyl-L-alanyl-D-glutamate--2,6-diaminopimelate ligase